MIENLDLLQNFLKDIRSIDYKVNKEVFETGSIKEEIGHFNRDDLSEVIHYNNEIDEKLHFLVVSTLMQDYLNSIEYVDNELGEKRDDSEIHYFEVCSLLSHNHFLCVRLNHVLKAIEQYDSWLYTQKTLRTMPKWLDSTLISVNGEKYSFLYNNSEQTIKIKTIPCKENAKSYIVIEIKLNKLIKNHIEIKSLDFKEKFKKSFEQSYLLKCLEFMKSIEFVDSVDNAGNKVMIEFQKQVFEPIKAYLTTLDENRNPPKALLDGDTKELHEIMIYYFALFQALFYKAYALALHEAKQNNNDNLAHQLTNFYNQNKYDLQGFFGKDYQIRKQNNIDQFMNFDHHFVHITDKNQIRYQITASPNLLMMIATNVYFGGDNHDDDNEVEFFFDIKVEQYSVNEHHSYDFISLR